MRLRSMLFAPGNSERKLRRALEGEADAVIADLEDSVPPAQKGEARAIVTEMLASTPARCLRFVRVNGARSGLLEADLAALAGMPLDGIVLPKADPSLAGRNIGRPVIAIVETAAGMAGVDEVAAAPGVHALLLGSVDLALELRLRARPDGAELSFYRSRLVLSSAVAGIAAPLDGVHVDLRDAVGLAEQCNLARTFGMGGKACIHPAQVEIVNRVFSPTEAEREDAARIVEAYDDALADGSGAISLDGRMIDLPVVEHARRMLSNDA